MMEGVQVLQVNTVGHLTAIYDERIDLASFGEVSIRRASHVEPDRYGHWTADLSPVGGPLLGPFGKRSAAIAAELRWLTVWLAEKTDVSDVTDDSGRARARPEAFPSTP